MEKRKDFLFEKARKEILGGDEMEEKMSKSISKHLFFEKTDQKITVSINVDNIKQSDIYKIKDFLNAMFKEILDEIICC